MSNGNMAIPDFWSAFAIDISMKYITNCYHYTIFLVHSLL
ncbi:hypothetical protein PRUB_b0156 [Pseudoalteromonas rubra]|uniref:Uncharacterized protein n=1 Tax=Pseudoalteromonas rubra TaxID=43658 RepID=A0A8T0BYY5_9GAMM|nr:hypothetical protein PRUB_b0156 [Pseudoalteromonas rubra]